MPLITLKRRREFLAVRGGGRWATAAFVVEAKARVAALAATTLPATLSGSDGGTASGEAAAPRFGFTVTKQIGNAVVRNRVRRRLKAAVTKLQAAHARPGFDYVIIARSAVVERPFAQLEGDLGEAFRRVHGRRQADHRSRREPSRDK